MLVSIFIPTYNASVCIDDTLNSVLSQTYSELEVYVVDDCSTDDTPQKLDEWAKKDARIRVVHKERNEGFVPFSWNRVLPLLKGEYTLYLSHDDRLSSDCIEQLVNTQRATEAECVIPQVVFWKAEAQEKEIQDQDCTLHSRGCWEKSSTPVSGRKAFAEMLNYDIPGFALWKTDLIRRIGMPTDAWNSDEGMQRIWALNCRRVAFCPEGKFYYRLTPSSITKGLKPYHLTGLNTQKRLMKKALSVGLLFTSPSAFCRFFWQYIRSYRYLMLNKKSLLS